MLVYNVINIPCILSTNGLVSLLGLTQSSGFGLVLYEGPLIARNFQHLKSLVIFCSYIKTTCLTQKILTLRQIDAFNLLATVSVNLCFPELAFPCGQSLFSICSKVWKWRERSLFNWFAETSTFWRMDQALWDIHKEWLLADSVTAKAWRSLFITGTGCKYVPKEFELGGLRLVSTDYFFKNGCSTCFNGWANNMQVSKGQQLRQEFVNLIWLALTW